MPLEGVASAIPALGQVVGGKYLIQRLLGEGGMASVFEALHRRLGQRVALKLLAPEFARDAELVMRFEREARALALLKSRHVARVIDVDATLDGVPYIVMEFLEGRDFENEIEARGRIPYEEAVDYVLQACAAMAEAHAAGIVHRDLKPANLFLAEDNGERIVKVLDFGISKIVGETTRLTGSGAVMGTVLYMSPEQVRATQDVDTRADIWSLGTILFELLAAKPPWQGKSHQIAAAIVSTDAPDIRTFVSVPDALAAAIRTALMRDRDQRFGSVRELAGALAPFAAAGSLGATIADQLVSGQSAPRMRPPYASVPNISLSPVSSSHPSHPSFGPRAAASGPMPAVATPTRPPTQPRAPLIALVATLGVLAVVGLVLTLVAIAARRQTVATSEPSTAATTSALGSPPADPPAPSAQTRLPPPTGVPSATASAAVTPAGTAPHRAPAASSSARPGPLPPSVPPAASRPPTFL